MPDPWLLQLIYVGYLNRFRMTPMDAGTGAVVQSSDQHFTGFTLSELACIWRYRVRTA